MITQHTRVPRDRLGALIGKKGKTKREIEKRLGVRLTIDSESGDVESESKDPIMQEKAKDIVMAIARGFSPENAMKLLDEGNSLKIIWLKEELGKKPKAIRTKKARIIGAKGAVRERIEQSTKALVSVYGNTVALIGGENELELAEQAVERILAGAKIGNVYDFIEEKKKETGKFEL